jgi:hypothetical protein
VSYKITKFTTITNRPSLKYLTEGYETHSTKIRLMNKCPIILFSVGIEDQGHALENRMQALRRELEEKEAQRAAAVAQKGVLDVQTSKLQLQLEANQRSKEEVIEKYEALRSEGRYCRQQVLQAVKYAVDIDVSKYIYICIYIYIYMYIYIYICMNICRNTYIKDIYKLQLYMQIFIYSYIYV